MGLKKISIQEIMRRALEKAVVIPAFNIAHIPILKPVAEALQATGTFGLIELARPDVEKFGAVSFKAVAEEYGKFADEDFMRLHQDHIPVIDEDGLAVEWRLLIKEAIANGYSSVMIDGSRLPLEENISVTREVVEMAHPKGVAVEAELGAVLGHEEGPLPPYEELFRSGKGFTRVDEARRFVAETGVDWLSVAVGSVHGAISEAARFEKKISARIHIEHLRKLKEATRVPLVLHGGSGIEKVSVLQAIENGITKINIGTEIRQAYERYLAEHPNDIEGARKAVAKKVAWIIEDYYGVKGSAKHLLE